MLSSKILKRRAPLSWIAALRARADVLNIPQIASSDNEGFFTHIQLNIAAPAKFKANSTLTGDLKAAGGAHEDATDDPFSLSALTALGDLGEMHPGHMNLVELGLYRRLEYMSTLFFSGRHIHGSTPPQPLEEDFIILRSFFRIAGICYLKIVTIDRLRRGALTICSSPLPRTFGLESDLRNYSQPGYRNTDHLPPLSFAHDGAAVMSRPSLSTFIVRELLYVVLSLLKGMEHSLPIRLNPSAFLGAFSFQGEDGDWVQIGDWPNAPGVSVAIEEERNRVDELIVQLTWDTSLLIPKIVASAEFDKYRSKPPEITSIPGAPLFTVELEDMEAVESLLQLGDDIEMDVETYASGNPQQRLEDEASDLDVGEGEEEIMDIDENWRPPLRRRVRMRMRMHRLGLRYWSNGAG